MNQNHENGLNVLLASSGLAQLDELRVEIAANRLLGSGASPDGLVNSLLHGQLGEQIDAIGPFIPGPDPAHRVDIVNSYASGQTKARKTLSDASPAALHIVLDMPKRFDILTGNFAAKNIGGFALALCSRATYELGSELMVYHSDGRSAGLIFEGKTADMYQAVNQIEGDAERLDLDSSDPSLEGLLALVQDHAEPENDALFIVSDFRDGYEEAIDTFSWELTLQQAQEAYGDRLWAVRIASLAHAALPPGLYGELSLDSIVAINTQFADLAAHQDNRIEEVLKDIRHVTVDTLRDNNYEHPATKLTQFILGKITE